jgi:ribonucleoside-diphosphate reductase alpha chain
MWDQTDCVGYLKTAAVLAAYIDQSLSTNTFYSPKHFADGKVPGTLIARNLMLAYKWGLKTMYYSLLSKTDSKHVLTTSQHTSESEPVTVYEDEDDCSSCKL